VTSARAIDFGKVHARARHAAGPASGGPDLLDGYPWTDSGNAERMVALHGADLRYVRTWQKWLAWAGKRWALDDGAVYRAAKATARTLMRRAQAVEGEEARKAAIKYALKCEDKRAIEAMVSLARHELAVAVHHERLDRDPWLLNFDNGTIDLRSGNLRPHAREDLITKLAPVAHDPDARCERFRRFVAEIALGQFFETECVFAPDAKVARCEIRDRYIEWSSESGEPPVNAKAFAEALRQRGALERQVRTAVGSRRGWVGVRLAVAAERDERGQVATCGHGTAFQYDGVPIETANREPVATGGHLTTESQAGPVASSAAKVAATVSAEQAEKGDKHGFEA
jgi:hypothetical protein